MTDQKTPTLESMSQDPRFSIVSRKTLERWSKEDGWVEKRATFFRTWSERARDRLGSELCRLRQRDLADLETVRSIAMEKLGDGALIPKSWEGVAKILMDATEHRERLATAIAAEVMPGQDDTKPLTPADVGVSSEELQLAAKAILQQRRDIMQAALADGRPVIDVTVGSLEGAPAAPTAASTLGPMPVRIEGQFVTAPPQEERTLSLGIGSEDEDEDEDEAAASPPDRAVFEDEDGFKKDV